MSQNLIQNYYDLAILNARLYLLEKIAVLFKEIPIINTFKDYYSHFSFSDSYLDREIFISCLELEENIDNYNLFLFTRPKDKRIELIELGYIINMYSFKREYDNIKNILQSNHPIFNKKIDIKNIAIKIEEIKNIVELYKI